MSDISKNLWHRTGAGDLSLRTYGFAVAVMFVWAMFLVVLGGRLGAAWGGSWGLSIIAFIGAIIGISIYSSSDEASTSFFGASLLSFSLGMSVGPLVVLYSAYVVTKALVLTLGVTVLMGVLAILIPDKIRGAGGILFAVLCFLMIAWFGQFILLLFGIYFPLTLLDYVAALLFSLYIWYDMSRALQLPPTWNNAIDASAAIIVDVVNLFVTLLRIIGRSQ